MSNYRALLLHQQEAEEDVEVEEDVETKLQGPNQVIQPVIKRALSIEFGGAELIFKTGEINLILARVYFKVVSGPAALSSYCEYRDLDTFNKWSQILFPNLQRPIPKTEFLTGH